jgi:hypothetical protein
MARQGFRPVVRRHATGSDLVLRTCPYASVATIDPSTVCDLHVGWAEGFLDNASNLNVTGAVVRHPRDAGCVIEIGDVPRLGDEPPLPSTD